MTTSLRLLKRTLRKDMTTRLKQVSSESIATQSDLVFQQLLQLDIFQKSQNISVYISTPTCEINTRAMIQHIIQADKTCYIPRCTKDSMDMVKITSWEDYLSLPINKWDIPEPPLDEPRENALEKDGLDLILVPGVAFDQEKNRIGHGKGYYDRYLLKYQDWANTNHRPMVKTVALALQEQMVDVGVIPLQETDQKVDYILTPHQKIQ
ncbi:5-formyltetrahydrofolate cyclo-ligase [Halteromyces radiatus]|uniref:5-formyltetrahydrofolate cyclo-ligase n=1 Tax=Halteromyces radiatus TaxID=101107 RepID=UPI00221EF297|nr:5-formyltetrahydrofolate cyclo-ligase [Halteromyces radiatus]KAI8099371.1 5-formyltetrahydrofolate cyclo-ligase [Halteromyces radiatus]